MRLYWALAAAAIAWGLWRAFALRWVCDDIFVTFRYIENCLHGKGLVFNEGERVEGFTHFLWLWAIFPFQAAGVDPVAAALGLGIAAYAGVLGLSAQISRRLFRPSVATVPFVTLALALHYDAQSWATSGLETMFFTFCLTLAFWLYYFTSLERRVRLVVAGAAVIAAALTRPDGVLFFLLANLLLLGRAWMRRVPFGPFVKDVACLNAAFVAFYLPVAAWTIWYYGDLVPNTYYAKAAYLSNYPEGYYYLGLYAWAYPSVLAAGLAAAALGWREWRWFRRVGLRSSAIRLTRAPGRAAVAAACGAVAVYSVSFIARVGGDFMFARFVIPLLPFVFVCAQYGVGAVLRFRAPWMTAALLALAVIVAAESQRRLHFFPAPGEDSNSIDRFHGITDERAYYTEKTSNFRTMSLVELSRRVGKGLEPDFAGLDVVVLAAAQNALAYYAKFKTCIEFYGLTDAAIARQPIDRETLRQRRVGHIQAPTAEYLAERGVDLMFLRPSEGIPEYQVASMRLRDGMRIRVELITYDKRLLEALRRRVGDRIEYVDFEQFLDRYVSRELPRRRPEDVAADYEQFRYYYFFGNPGTAWERAMLDRMGVLAPGLPRYGPLR